MMRRAAVDNLRYSSGLGPECGSERQREPTPEERTAQERFRRNYNRQQALGHTLALGRRYDRAEDAITDAKVIAEWIGLDID